MRYRLRRIILYCAFREMGRGRWIIISTWWRGVVIV
jgi:hypothetical protein